MIVETKTIEQLKNEFNICFRNNCGDKVTKFSDLSVINGFSFALSKIVQKVIKSAAQIESKLFPESANGTALDDIASRQGIPARRAKSKSSVVLLFKASEGTTYPINTQVKTASGIIVSTQSELVINSNGYGYVLAESTTYGIEANVLANTLVTLVATAPVGHTSVTNPMRAIGGADEESDYTFRNRLINGEHILSRNTEAFYEALIINSNSNVMRINMSGLDIVNKSFEVVLVKNSLADFTNEEIDAIKEDIIDNLPMSDRNLVKLNVSSINYEAIDLFIPLRLTAGYTLANVLRDIQINLATYLDLTRWDFGKTVSWADMYEIIRHTEGVYEIIDTFYSPKKDVLVGSNSLPRIRQVTIKNVDTDEQIGESFTNAFWIRDNSENYFFNQIIG